MFKDEITAIGKARRRIRQLGLDADEDHVVEIGMTALLLRGEFTCLDAAVDQAIEIVLRPRAA